MAKRACTTDLYFNDGDQEEEPEDIGVFQKANAEVLRKREIKTAKRHVRMSDSSSDSKPSPFSGFTGFGNATSTSNSPFSFLSQNSAKVLARDDKNGAKQENNVSSLTKETQPQFKSVTNTFSSTNQENNLSNFSSNLIKSNSTTTDTTFKPFEHIFKPTKPTNENENENENEKDKKSKNLELLKDLNLSCSNWIIEHVQKNPYCILTPIFKDYEKHLAQIDLNTHSDNKDIEIVAEKTNTVKNSTAEPEKFFIPAKEESVASNPSEKEKEKEEQKEKAAEFKFEATQTKSPFNFQFNSGSTTFGAATTPFSLNQIAAKPIVAETESINDEDAEEPPKNDFVPVIEEDSIFDIKCKVFVKKEGNFVSRGVGTLFLKPVKDNTKTQLIVRAHTKLGNILLNTLLVPGMHIQKTGKNNAMIVCIPTPESKPPPVPVLIRVKTSDECDGLIKKLEECRGSK